jgi:hypothetical protein
LREIKFLLFGCEGSKKREKHRKKSKESMRKTGTKNEGRKEREGMLRKN